MTDDGIVNQVLYENIGKLTLVKLKGRKSIKGRLKGFDRQMNLMIADAIEISEQKSDGGEKVTKEVQLGDILLRGDNVIIISVL